MEKDTINEEKKSDILYHAQRCLYYNELLIEQCDNWLSAEEGDANMMKAYEARYKAERKAKIQKFKNFALKLTQIFVKKTKSNADNAEKHRFYPKKNPRASVSSVFHSIKNRKF